jgi:cell division protein FtsB
LAAAQVNLFTASLQRRLRRGVAVIRRRGIATTLKPGIATTRRSVVFSLKSGRTSGVRIWRAIKRAFRAALPPAIFLALVAYFGWNATRGDRGLVAYAERQKLLATAQADEARAETQRDRWEKRVAALRANHLDPDALDENARAMLNLSDPSDIIVPYPPNQKLY